MSIINKLFAPKNNGKQIKKLYLYYGGYFYRNIILAENQITYYNTKSMTCANHDFPKKYFEQKVKKINQKEYGQIMQNLIETRFWEFVQEDTISASNEYISYYLLECEFDDHTKYMYVTDRKVPDFFQKVINVLEVYCDFASLGFPGDQTKQSANKLVKIITPCCKYKIDERYSYCPMCGTEMINKKHLERVKEAVDLESTSWACITCGEIQSMYHKYCVKCGHKMSGIEDYK